MWTCFLLQALYRYRLRLVFGEDTTSREEFNPAGCSQDVARSLVLLEFEVVGVALQDGQGDRYNLAHRTMEDYDYMLFPGAESN